jgi:hypothetical protein
MTTLNEAAEFIRGEYHRIWSDWYRTDPAAKPAKVDIQDGECSAGYSYSQNTLVICIPNGNLEDFDTWRSGRRSPGSQLGWYANQRELVHEMIHEFEKKRITAVSPTGLALYEKYGRTFPGPGHDARFFTAIADRAPYFAVTPYELIAEL